jgi:hypothetical protein
MIPPPAILIDSDTVESQQIKFFTHNNQRNAALQHPIKLAQRENKHQIAQAR